MAHILVLWADAPKAKGSVTAIPSFYHFIAELALSAVGSIGRIISTAALDCNSLVPRRRESISSPNTIKSPLRSIPQYETDFAEFGATLSS
jgi:hypothetical protein